MQSKSRRCFYVCPTGPLDLGLLPWISPLVLAQKECLGVNSWTQEVINKPYVYTEYCTWIYSIVSHT